MDDEKQDSASDRCPVIIYFLTEFVGVAILMWVGCMGCIEFFGMGPLMPAFTFGMAVLTAVQSFGHISPVHINPAVTLGVLILGKMGIVQVAVYWLAQYLGAIAGYGLLYVVMPKSNMQVCLLEPGFNMTVMKAFGIEFGIAVCLMLVVASAEDIHTQNYKDSLPLKFGFIIAGLVFAAAPFTGAGLNPARSVPPPLFYNNWANHWVYHVGPFAGMAFAALLYRFVFDSTEQYSAHSLIKSKCQWCSV